MVDANHHGLVSLDYRGGCEPFTRVWSKSCGLTFALILMESRLNRAEIGSEPAPHRTTIPAVTQAGMGGICGAIGAYSSERPVEIVAAIALRWAMMPKARPTPPNTTATTRAAIPSAMAVPDELDADETRALSPAAVWVS